MKFKLFDKTFQAGESATLAMPLPSMYSCAPMYLPIKNTKWDKRRSMYISLWYA